MRTSVSSRLKTLGRPLVMKGMYIVCMLMLALAQAKHGPVGQGSCSTCSQRVSQHHWPGGCRPADPNTGMSMATGLLSNCSTTLAYLCCD